MAKTYKAVMSFYDADGKTIKFTYPNAKPLVNASDAKTAMNAMITNGAIFKKVPVSKKSYIVLSTEESSIDVTD